ncbi:hypothetical protein MLD38_015607 [Melastoma candidum]|uniref:Uncharacterized protein n=1 Tax=Melastoma candidum TaxID=119954 RepID=A0ACB9RGQ8_9MYRT|nr:hypothetical protein MLD38_015607 [Melastoma candidum]
MQIEKRRSKGGFLQFFDWNSKSRKKLFSNGGDSFGPGGSRQGIEDRELSANSRIMNAANGSGVSPGNERNNDWNCASSETSNDEYESRVPGVVARLMGLDSLPNSSVTDHSSTSSDGFRPTKLSSDSIADKYDPTVYLGSSRRLNGFASTLVEAKVPKAHNRPLERFQTEVLPPKSAKLISAARHRLSSPIRSLGTFPAKNPEYIIEAAAKILEVSPRVTGDRATSSISASVPLRIRDLKAKLEVAYEASKCQIHHESHSVKNVGRKPRDKEHCRLEDSHDSRTAVVPLKKGNSNGGRYKGKSPTTEVASKASLQQREEMSRLSKRNVSQGRHEGNSNQMPSRQQSMLKTTQRKPSVNKRMLVLQQNNQKQNSIPIGSYSTSRSSSSNHQLVRANSTNGYHKNVNMGSTKYAQINMKKPPPDARHGYNLSRVNALPQNRCSSSSDSQVRSIATNILITSDAVSQSKNNNKKGMDVISFTFSSPIKKCSRETISDGQNSGKDCRDATSDVNNSNLSLEGLISLSPPQSVIDGNSLSILLEQKLRELTSRIQSSDFETAVQESVCSSTRSMEETASSVIAGLTYADHEKVFHKVPDENMNIPFSFACSSMKDGGARDPEGVINTNSSRGTGKEVDFQQPSPISILEPSFESRSPDGISPNCKRKECSLSSPGEQEMFKWLHGGEFPARDDESEFSYSSCSSFRTEFDSKRHISRSMTSNGSRNWELAYIEDIIRYFGSILPEVLLTPRNECELPSHYGELEDQMYRMGEYEHKRRDRCKLLFDCAAEHVDSRCRQIFNGTDRSWEECGRMFKRKTWFVDEVYGEISRRGIGDMLVDELVDADMGSRHGKWIEFNAEIYEEGVTIGKEILVSLIDELATDFCAGQRQL